VLLREFADSQLSADLQWLSDRTVALQEPDIAYNDLAQWHYADLPKALGCDNWFTARVTTCKEFDQPLTEHPRPRSQNF
jgi:TPP-dependent 2-oxoacid decarboxylase